MKQFDLDLKPAEDNPTCLGSGFMALDIVEGRHGNFATVGGSCGNVMSILAWLGWTATISGRLLDDVAGQFIKDELDDIGVKTEHLALEEKGESPIVIQKFVESENGQRSHRFSLTCPDCRRWLPRYRPMTLRHAATVIEAGLTPKVYYFDRTAPATLRLANWAKDQDAIVVFEPSSIGDEGQFQKAVDVCHILKYSKERLGHVHDLEEAKAPKIVIETAGSEGLKVRWKGRWSRLSAFKTPVFEDAAGSGDWCTAGLIHRLGRSGVAGIETIRKADLEGALHFGQAVAAVNCGFEGARGAMMVLSHEEFDMALESLTSPNSDDALDWQSVDRPERKMPNGFCFTCSGDKSDDLKHESA